MSLVDAILADPCLQQELYAAGCREGASVILVTPRFRTSRHVVALVLEREHGRAVAVVKVPRLASDTGGIAHEASVLRSLACRWPEGHAAIPRVLAVGTWAGHPALVETAVRGRALTHRVAATRPARCMQAVDARLTQLPVAARSSDDPRWFERLVQTPVERLATVAADRDTAQLVTQTMALVRPLLTAELPLVQEHGDVTHPNVLLDRVTGVGLVDWELSEPAGLPAHDHLLFLAFVAFALARAHDVCGQVRAFDEAFFGPRPWAAEHARRHLRRRGVDPSLLGPLLVTTWARYVAHLVPRLGSLAGDGVLAARSLLSQVLAQDRDAAVWRHLVQARTQALPRLGAAPLPWPSRGRPSREED